MIGYVVSAAELCRELTTPSSVVLHHNMLTKIKTGVIVEMLFSDQLMLLVRL